MIFNNTIILLILSRNQVCLYGFQVSTLSFFTLVRWIKVMSKVSFVYVQHLNFYNICSIVGYIQSLFLLFTSYMAASGTYILFDGMFFLSPSFPHFNLLSLYMWVGVVVFIQVILLCCNWCEMCYSIFKLWDEI